MKYVGYAACAVLLACAWTVGCGKTEPAAGSTAGAAVVQKTCPVLGNPFDKKVSTEYNGQTVYFCCAACVPKFEKEPEEYLPKLETWCTKCNAWKAECGCK